MAYGLLGILAALGLFFLWPKKAAASIPTTQPSQPPALGGLFDWSTMNTDNNVTAFLALIRHIEANDDYTVIAGGDHFSDFSEHPFVLNPNRPKLLGTTASGGYQMVKGTWIMARDALGLTDFSPASQDAAAIWILQVKRPGAYDAVAKGDFSIAVSLLQNEWESFAKMMQGTYPITYNDAQDFYTSNGGTLT
jgi:muramidase (phage lysozyme)